MPWTDNIPFTKQGESVSPGVDNRAVRTVDANVRYLKQQWEAASLGQALFLREAAVSDETIVGNPVYFNADTGKFEPALAAAEVSEVNGVFQTAASSRVWGVVYLKHSAGSADIVVLGVVTGLDLSSVITDETPAGLYYLSSSTAGKLVSQEPPVSVPVLEVAGDAVFVRGNIRDFLHNHVHYRFELTAAPAGDYAEPGMGERHEITNPDPDLPGWLPADHEIFGGNAPPGAAFGYNLSQHPELEALWPPIPLGNAYVEWHRGESPDQGLEGVPLGETGLCMLDRHGIWWMSDCNGEVPWASDYPANESISDSSDIECPRQVQKQVVLWFNRITFANDQTVVASLRSRDSRIRVYCVGTDTEKFVGHLELDLDLGLLLSDDDDDEGAYALKGLDEDTDRFTLGPVVTGLVAGSANVVLTSDVQREIEEDTVHFGVVEVQVLPETAIDLPARMVSVDDVTEENDPTLFLGMPAGINSSYQVVVDVPDSLDGTLSCALRLRLLGKSAGTLPALTVERKILSRPADGLNTPESVPSSWTAVTITTTGAVGANEYVEATSTAFSVAAGDSVVFQISRADDDAYAGMVGILKQGVVLGVS